MIGAISIGATITALLSILGTVGCITGCEPDENPNGDRGGATLLGDEVVGEEGREGDGADRGADDPPLRTGAPLATPLSNSSSGSNRWACTSFIIPSSR